MKDNRGGEKYLDMYPKLKKWINTCSCCHDRGYNPTMPEKITVVDGSVDVNNIKKAF